MVCSGLQDGAVVCQYSCIFTLRDDAAGGSYLLQIMIPLPHSWGNTGNLLKRSRKTSLIVTGRSACCRIYSTARRNCQVVSPPFWLVVGTARRPAALWPTLRND